jgi:hypothetical protein
MVPPESLWNYLSNDYQCYGVSTESGVSGFLLHTFKNKLPNNVLVDARLSIQYFRKQSRKITNIFWILILVTKVDG